jgi:DNA-binding SARP family transcriptional activator
VVGGVTNADEVRLLGPVQLIRSGSVVELSPSSRRLIALLGLRGPTRRSLLAELLWPSMRGDRGQGNLRSAVWRLQGRVPGFLRVGHHVLALDDGVGVDVHQVSKLGRDLVDGFLGAIPHFAVWAPLQCELLPEEDDEWAMIEKERFRQLRLHAMEALCVRLRAEARYAEAIEAAHAAIAAEPLRESAHRCLIGVHLDEGNDVEALAAYHRFARTLAAEVGLAPSPALRRMLDQPLSAAVMVS